jgi:hypothetical protein|tara:strand:- start:6385 stop:6717 length:333 start_codon:yes stop_codon:yes gene_type:complete
MKMNSDFDIDSSIVNDIIRDIKARDLVELKTIYQDRANYLVLQVLKNKLSIRALPIGSLIGMDDAVAIPALDIPFYMIKGYRKIDKSSLLFLINQNNPHIIKAVKDFIKE